MVDTSSPSFLIHLTIAALIVFGNSSVIYLYFSERLLRKISNKFVISLAFCDLLIAIVFIPCHEFFSEQIERAIHLPVSAYVASIVGYGSLLNLAALTYDRYVAIFDSLRYHAIITKKRVAFIMAIIWTICAFVTLLPLSWKFALSPEKDSFFLHIYQTILTIIIIIIHIAITLVYIMIFMVNRRHLVAERRESNRFKRHQSRLQDEQSQMNEGLDSEKQAKNLVKKLTNSRAVAVEMKAARIVLLMFVINSVCWLPTVILNVTYLVSWYRKAPVISQLWLQLSNYSFLANSVINPWTYGLLKEDFRNAFKKRVCGKRRMQSTSSFI